MHKQARRYFQARPGYGLFVRPAQVTALTTTGPGISPVTRPALTSPQLAGAADTSLSAAAGTLAPDSVEDTIFEDLRAGGTSSTVQ